MDKETFIKYCASFNEEYVTKETAKSLIKQAKKIQSDE